jgi:predicted nuclease with RNAse H fold
VITLGIDLASRPERTAACTIDWTDGRARVVDLACGQDDEALLARIAAADKVGIDAPFGWPEAFVDAVARFHAGGPWPAAPVVALRYRETDRVVAARTGRWPLSVSTDLIGVPAFRVARLLTRLAEHGEKVDRAGGGRLVETYPAAALRVWGFASTGYKRPAGRPSLGRLLAALRKRTRNWLDVDATARRLCGRSDDALDALVAALIARASALGLCAPPPAEHAARAALEGWIALPEPDGLQALAATPSRGSPSGSARRRSRASSRPRP